MRLNYAVLTVNLESNQDLLIALMAHDVDGQAVLPRRMYERITVEKVTRQRNVILLDYFLVRTGDKQRRALLEKLRQTKQGHLVVRFLVDDCR